VDQARFVGARDDANVDPGLAADLCNEIAAVLRFTNG
jgi:hypothetical protein